MFNQQPDRKEVVTRHSEESQVAFAYGGNEWNRRNLRM
jgi:hypothetical protein